MESLAGKLLVSSPSLLDPNFRRTVVLMTHHDEDGAMGLVLSRPSPLSVEDSVPGLADLPGADCIYVGGPVQTEVIVALTSRGQHAAAALVDRFANPPADPGDLSWDSHRWTRLRSTLAAVAELTSLFDESYSDAPDQPGDRTYAELSGRADDDHPRAYRWSARAQRQLGEDLVAELHSAAQVLRAASPTSIEQGAPRPRPEIRLAPRD